MPVKNHIGFVVFCLLYMNYVSAFSHISQKQKFAVDSLLQRSLDFPDAIYQAAAIDSSATADFLQKENNFSDPFIFQSAIENYVFCKKTQHSFDSAVQNCSYSAIIFYGTKVCSQNDTTNRAIAFAHYQLQHFDSCIFYWRKSNDTTDSSLLMAAACFEKLQATDSALNYYAMLSAKNKQNQYFAKKAKAIKWSEFLTDNWYYVLALLALIILLLWSIFKIFTKKNPYES